MSKGPEIGVIRRVPGDGSGIEDGVEVYVNSTVTHFNRKGGKVTGINGMDMVPCKMLASFDTGVLSISLRKGKAMMVSVRIDEVMELLKAAVEAAGAGEAQGGGEAADE